MAEQPFYKLYGHVDMLATYLRMPAEKIRKVCKWDHGWTPLDKPLAKEVTSPKSIVLVWNKRRKQIIGRDTDKKALITGVPFIHHRKAQGIKKSAYAEGNVFMAAHSSQHTDIRYDIDELQLEFEKLPMPCRPTTICLYWLDMEKGYKEIYEQLGYEVVTAGDPYSEDFFKNFYDILSRFAYCSSNSFGTYALYALDLGIPFYLVGGKPELLNKGDANAALQRGEGFYKLKERIEQLFRYRGGEMIITEDQRTFFLEESGEQDLDSPTRIRWWVQYFWIKKTIQLQLTSGN